jgi:hypothetical protein
VSKAKMEPAESNIPRENSISKSGMLDSRNEVRNNRIAVTKCLSQHCTGFYTDSLSEYFLIKCLDPKHNIDEVGHQPTPAVDGTTPRRQGMSVYESRVASQR